MLPMAAHESPGGREWSISKNIKREKSTELTYTNTERNSIQRIAQNRQEANFVNTKSDRTTGAI